MTDPTTYSTLELPVAALAQGDYRPWPKAVPSRLSLTGIVTLMLGLLSAVLTSLLLHQRIVCQGSAHSTCPHCPSCPELWTRYGDHCYYFSMEKNDWNSSWEFCTARDAHLLMVTDSQEMVDGDFENENGAGAGAAVGFAVTVHRTLVLRARKLTAVISQEDFYWIGLRKGSDWRWEDGSSLNFSRVYSNSWVQQCAAIGKADFHASSCEVPLRWICKEGRL